MTAIFIIFRNYCRNCKYSFECFLGTFGFEIALRSACFLGRWFSAGFTFCLPMCWVYLIHKQCSGRLGWSEHWTYINPCCFPVIFLFLSLDFFLCFWYRYYGNTGTICGGTDGTKFLRYRETLLTTPLVSQTSKCHKNKLKYSRNKAKLVSDILDSLLYRRKTIGSIE